MRFLSLCFAAFLAFGSGVVHLDASAFHLGCGISDEILCSALGLFGCAVNVFFGIHFALSFPLILCAASENLFSYNRFFEYFSKKRKILLKIAEKYSIIYAYSK